MGRAGGAERVRLVETRRDGHGPRAHGTRARDIVRRVTDEGRIVLLRSTELPELLGLCDRILVFYRGRIVADRPAESFDSRSLLHAINTGEVPENLEAEL